MAAAGASLVTRLGVDGLPQYIGGMRSAGEEVDKFAKKSNRSLSSVAQGMKDTGSKLTRNVTLPIVAAGAASFIAFAGFDKTMRQFGANADLGGKALKGFSSLAIKMGKETSFSAGQAAQAMLELSKGGMTSAEIKGGALKQTLTLAAAGGVELAEAAGFMSNTLNMFGLDSSKAGNAAAALAGGANASTASVQSLGQGLAQVGLAARNSGLSMEETVAILGVLDDNAVKGSDGGTSLKAMLNSLTPATDGARAAMEKYNLEFVKGNGTFKSGAEIAGELKKELGGLKEAERAAALERIFGSDGMRAATALMNGGADAVRTYTAATSDLSQAEKLAKTNTEGAAGSIEQMTGSLSTAGIAIGSSISPAVVTLMGGVTGLANAFTTLPSGVQTSIVGLAGFTAVVGPMLVMLGQAITAVTAIKTALSGVAIAAVLTNPLVLLGAAAGIAAVGILASKDATVSLGTSAREASAAVTALNTATSNLQGNNLSVIEAENSLASAMQSHKAAVISVTDAKSKYGAKSKEAAAAILSEKTAATAVERAQMTLAEARKKNAKGLNDATAASKDNAAILKTETALSARLKEKLDDIKKGYRVKGNNNVDELSKQLKASEDRAKKAKAALDATGKAVAAIGDGAPGATTKVSALKTVIDNMPHEKSVVFNVQVKASGRTSLLPDYNAGGIVGYASGGLIPGRGPNKDTVLAALTKGEFVMDRNTVDKFGPDFFRGLQGFNRGGAVKKSLAQAGTRAAIAANPMRALKQAEQEHKNAINAMNKIPAAKKDEKKAARDNVKSKADAVIAARKALADFKSSGLTSRTDKALAGQEVLNSRASALANNTSGLSDDIAATDGSIATNNQRIDKLKADMKGTKGPARQQLQEQLNAAIERQISLDGQRNSLITQQNDAVKQAALEAPRTQMVLRDAQTNYAMALAKATPGIEDDLAAMSAAIQDEVARRNSINLAFAAATTDEERAALTNQLAESVNATTALTEQMQSAAASSENLAAELDKSRRREDIERERANLSEQGLRILSGAGDIGLGQGSNALNSSRPIVNNNIYALSGNDPAIQKALSETSNAGNSSGESANALYSGRVA